MKKYTPEELQTKSDSVAKLSDNIKILGELYEENQRNIGKALRGVDENLIVPTEDIENQLLFKSASNGGMMNGGFEGFRTIGKGNQDQHATS